MVTDFHNMNVFSFVHQKLDFFLFRLLFKCYWDVDVCAGYIAGNLNDLVSLQPGCDLPSFLPAFLPTSALRFPLRIWRYDGPRNMRVALAKLDGDHSDVEAETSLLHRMLRGSLDQLEEPCLVNRSPQWKAKVRILVELLLVGTWRMLAARVRHSRGPCRRDFFNDWPGLWLGNIFISPAVSVALECWWREIDATSTACT